MDKPLHFFSGDSLVFGWNNQRGVILEVMFLFFEDIRTLVALLRGLLTAMLLFIAAL